MWRREVGMWILSGIGDTVPIPKDNVSVEQTSDVDLCHHGVLTGIRKIEYTITAGRYDDVSRTLIICGPEYANIIAPCVESVSDAHDNVRNLTVRKFIARFRNLILDPLPNSVYVGESIDLLLPPHDIPPAA